MVGNDPLVYHIALVAAEYTKLQPDIDPYNYTSGRWLHNDKLERDARYIKFDFDELREKVIELCHGAPAILLSDFSNTTVPIPKILDWSDDASNAIGSEYIIMEHADGVQLHQKWPTMSGEQQIACIQTIFTNIQQISSIEFPAYGSLYFANSHIESASKVPLDSDFCIGSHCGTRGPWSDLATYCDGLVDTGLSRLPITEKPLHEKPNNQESIETHTRLLKIGRDVIHKLSEDPRIKETAPPTLYHPDLHKRNIFVSENDPTIVTAIIDWQSSSIEPTFEYADETPDFAAPNPNPSPEDKAGTSNIELCRQAFAICLQAFIPKLYAAKHLDETLLRPFRYCHRTWREGATAFRQELIDLASQWKELGLPDECPYPLPSSDELVGYRKEFEKFMAAKDLKQKLMNLLGIPSDGWVPIEAWEATREAHKGAFDEIVKALREARLEGENEMSEEELRGMWPFDLD
ncbi:MAG: hypothetical protein Q9168_004264 [Polycauliona sp. 1 TL-2023]